jgi:hypothetical protein
MAARPNSARPARRSAQTFALTTAALMPVKIVQAEKHPELLTLPPQRGRSMKSRERIFSFNMTRKEGSYIAGIRLNGLRPLNPRVSTFVLLTPHTISRKRRGIPSTHTRAMCNGRTDGWNSLRGH